MSYIDKHAITKIVNSKRNNLCISVDQDDKDTGKYPVLLYTPSMDDTNDHYHIPLTRKEAVELILWLQSYLQDTTIYE